MYNSTADCSFFNSSLFNDLQKHTIDYDSSNDLKIQYEGPTNYSSYDIDIESSEITTYISSELSSISDYNAGAWYPVFITDDESDQNKKTILDKTNFQYDSLGINGFVKFTGKFNFWHSNNTANKMQSDWRLTNKYNNFLPTYGILFWFREVLEDQKTMKFYEMPAGTVFKDGGVWKKKVDFKTAKNLEIDRSQLTSSNDPQFNFTDEEELEDFTKDSAGLYPSEIENSKAAEEYTLLTHGFQDDSSSFKIDDKTYQIYVSEGEAFAFYENLVDKDKTLDKSIFSYSYCSPALHNIYREIYNALYPFDRGYVMTDNESRAFHLLCNFISTGPQLDRVIVNSLSKTEIKDKVLTFLEVTPGGQTTQLTKTRNIIEDIINESYSNLEYTEPNIQFINVVSNTLELCNRILNKYPPELTITADMKLTYVEPSGTEGTPRPTNKDKTSGIHCIYSNVSTIYYDENEVSGDDTVYNNYVIRHGSNSKYLEYNTDFSSSGSKSNIKAEDADRSFDDYVYYKDVGLNPYTVSNFYLGPGHLYTDPIHVSPNANTGGDTGIDSHAFDTLEGFNDVAAGAPFAMTFTWRVSKGPYGLRFNNIDGYTTKGTPYRFSTQNTSFNEDNVFVTVLASGTYELECTRAIGAFKQIDRTILTTDSNFSLPTDLSANYANDDIQFLHINCGLASSVAFDKAGLIWLIDTPHYMDTGSQGEQQNDDGTSAVRVEDVKLFLKDENSNERVFGEGSMENSELYFEFKPGNTTIGLYSLNISHLRDGCHPQCLSTYHKKLRSLRRGPAGVGEYQDTFFTEKGEEILRPQITFDWGHNYFIGGIGGFYTAEVDSDGNKTGEETEFGWDDYTGSVDVEVLPYGGFDEETRKGILGNSIIPGHTLPLENEEKVKVAEDYIKEPTGIYCYREQVPLIGNEMELNKGLFLPSTGFISDSHPSFIDNRSYALEDRTEQFDTHVFDGRGFYDLRPAVTGMNTHKSSIYINPDKITDYDNDLDPRRTIDSYGYKKSFTDGTRGGKDPTMYAAFQSTDNEVDENHATGELYESYDFFETESLEALIKNVEVNLNYLNYQNPQNLVFTLEMCVQDAPGINENQVEYETDYDLNNIRSIWSDNVDISGYVDKLYETHYLGNLCLINQEHIKNYNPNYVLRFSDFYDNTVVGSNRGGYVGDKMQSTHTNLVDHQNEERLQPTLAASGYGADDSYLSIINAMKHNNVFDSRFTFGKFKDKKIGGIKAKIKVNVINPIDYRTDILDNLLANDILSSLQSTDNRTTSNTIRNSLCNWELILHTGIDPNYGRKDVLGLISYDKNKFIGNTGLGPFNYIFEPFTKANIPKVNLNAPYQYIDGVTDCSYYDALNDDLGDTITELVGFPNLIAYLMLSVSFFGVTTGLGVMNGLIGLQSFYGNGGSNDPIVNYFRSQSFSENIDAVNVQMWRPVYRNYQLGRPERAIVCLSNNKSYWYATSVPIFRYNNTPVAEKDQLVYIKLHKNCAFSGLGRFKYRRLEDIASIDLLNCNYVIDKTYNGSLSGTGTITRNVIADSNSREQQIDLKEGDIIKLTNQDTVSDNGHWLVKTGSWVKFPSADTVFLQNNILSPEFCSSGGDLSADSSETAAFNIRIAAAEPGTRSQSDQSKTDSPGITIGQSGTIPDPYLDVEDQDLVTMFRRIKVNNSSYNTINNIIVTNNMPDLYTFQMIDVEIPSDSPFTITEKSYDSSFQVAASGSQGTYTVSRQEWDVGSLDSNAQAELTMRIVEIEGGSTDAPSGGGPPPPPPPGPGDESTGATTTYIIIDGYRAYYFFEDNKSVVLEDNSSATVLHRSLVATNEGYKTILGMDKNVESEGYVGVSEANCNTILVFNPKHTTSANFSKKGDINWTSDINHIYKWPLQEHNKGIRKNTYNSSFSTIGEGNIGYGTDVLRHGILDVEELQNKPFKLSEQANLNKNNRYKYFNFNLIYDSSESDYVRFSDSDTAGDKLKAYKYSIEDLGVYSINNGLSQELEKLSETEYESTVLDDVYKPIYLSMQQLSQQDFIEIKTDKIKDLDIANTGTILIDKDLNFNNKITYFSPSDYTAMSGAYDDIVGTGQAPYTSYEQAKYGDNINALNSFYEALSTDPDDCYKKDTWTADICKQTVIKQQIYAKKKQADEIYHAMNIAKTGNDIYPHTSGTFDPTEMIIRYEDTDYYWIHIDPENACYIASEASVKIPTRTEMSYEDVQTARSVAAMLDANMLPSAAGASDYAEPDNDNGYIKFEKNTPTTNEHVITYTDKRQQEIKDAWLAVDPTLDFSNMVEVSIGNKDTTGGRGGIDFNKMGLQVEGAGRASHMIWEDYYERPAALGSTREDYQIKTVIDFNSPVYMKFRVMPSRKLKYYDQRFEKMYPGEDGGLAKSVYGASTYTASDALMPFEYHCWRCVDDDGEYVDTPPFYKMMNEMIFRGFFGSTDGVEQTNEKILTSKDPWEWIPYDFAKSQAVSSQTRTLTFSAGGGDGHVCDRTVYELFVDETSYGILNLNNLPDGQLVEQTFEVSYDRTGCYKVRIELKCLCDKIPQHPDCSQGDLSCHNGVVRLRSYSSAGELLFDGYIGEVFDL